MGKVVVTYGALVGGHVGGVNVDEIVGFDVSDVWRYEGCGVGWTGAFDCEGVGIDVGALVGQRLGSLVAGVTDPPVAGLKLGALVGMKD